MISGGKMRETITIERPSGTRGSLGQTQWETFETARAELRFITGRELTAPQIGGSDVTHVFVLRYIAGVKGNMRIVLSGSSRIFQITYPVVQDEGNARTLQLFCREVMTA